MPGRGRHRHRRTTCPRELVAELGLHEVVALRHFEGEHRSARATCRPRRASTSRLTRARTSCRRTSQPSVGDFLAIYEPLLDDGHDIVSIHISGGISGTVDAAGQARDELVDRGLDPARLIVLDSATTCARPRHDGHGARPPPRAPERPSRRSPRPRTRCGATEDVVRARHARVPAPRRAHRRRAGVARLGAEDQADPLDRVRDRPDRAGAHLGARVRADGRVPARRATTTAATPGSSSTSAPPSRRSGWSSGAARSSATSPSSSPRSGRSSAPTRAPACSGSAACGASCWRPAAST